MLRKWEKGQYRKIGVPDAWKWPRSRMHCLADLDTHMSKKGTSNLTNSQFCENDKQLIHKKHRKWKGHSKVEAMKCENANTYSRRANAWFLHTLQYLSKRKKTSGEIEKNPAKLQRTKEERTSRWKYIMDWKEREELQEKTIEKNKEKIDRKTGCENVGFRRK